MAQVLSKGTRIDKGSVDDEGVGNSCWHITTKVSEVDAETFRSKQLKIFRTIQLGTEAEAPQGNWRRSACGRITPSRLESRDQTVHLGTDRRGDPKR
jgi:hypothetical protein